MKVRLTTDKHVENHHFASGEVVELSEPSGRLLIRKGQAIEYHEPVEFATRETATIKDDKAIDKHNIGGRLVKRNDGKRKGTSKGRA